jgi:hypothetical protein
VALLNEYLICFTLCTYRKSNRHHYIDMYTTVTNYLIRIFIFVYVILFNSIIIILYYSILNSGRPTLETVLSFVTYKHRCTVQQERPLPGTYRRRTTSFSNRTTVQFTGHPPTSNRFNQIQRLVKNKIFIQNTHLT